MAPKRDQLFTKEKFDAFMSDNDNDHDNDDDNFSVGSARGSIGGHSRIGGLGGLRPAGSPRKLGLGGLGGLGGGSKPSGGLGGLGGGSKPSGGGESHSGLGGLGGSHSGFGGLGGSHSGFGGLGGSHSGLGGLGGLQQDGSSQGGPKRGLGGGSKPSGGLGGSQSSLKLPGGPSTRQLGGLRLEDKATIPGNNDIVETLKNITSLLQHISEKTILGFQDVSNRLNQESGSDLVNVQEALDTLVQNIDEQIAAKNDEIYIIVPGQGARTLTVDEATEVMVNKTVRIFGGIGSIATIIQ